jgi:hypothetical protein
MTAISSVSSNVKPMPALAKAVAAPRVNDHDADDGVAAAPVKLATAGPGQVVDKKA